MRSLTEGLLARRPRDPHITSEAEAVCKLRLAGLTFCHFRNDFLDNRSELDLERLEAIGSTEEGIRELSITTKKHEVGGVLVAVQDSAKSGGVGTMDLSVDPCPRGAGCVQTGPLLRPRGRPKRKRRLCFGS
jgi:hypothetical protein